MNLTSILCSSTFPKETPSCHYRFVEAHATRPMGSQPVARPATRQAHERLGYSCTVYTAAYYINDEKACLGTRLDTRAGWVGGWREATQQPAASNPGGTHNG